MRPCIDKEIGQLLPAYELGALSEGDEDLFEIHLMQCEHCFNEVSSFQRQTGVLRDSGRVRGAMVQPADPSQPSNLMTTLLGHLWPDARLLFRPAVSILLVILLALPAYLGIRGLVKSRPGVRPAQMIRLLPNRANGNRTLSVRSGDDAVISFGLPEYVPGASYSVSIVDGEGEAVIQLDSFDLIDDRGMGQIIIPHELIRPGSYQLTVLRSSPTTTDGEYVYSFEVGP